jgi:hypothetical protein
MEIIDVHFDDTDLCAEDGEHVSEGTKQELLLYGYDESSYFVQRINSLMEVDTIELCSNEFKKARSYK